MNAASTVAAIWREAAYDRVADNPPLSSWAEAMDLSNTPLALPRRLAMKVPPPIPATLSMPGPVSSDAGDNADYSDADVRH